MMKEDILKKLKEIWMDVLEAEEEIPTDVSFFELGGNSMLATVMIENVNEAYNSEFELTEIYEYNTIDKLADYINDKLNTK